MVIYGNTHLHTHTQLVAMTVRLNFCLTLTLMEHNNIGPLLKFSVSIISSISTFIITNNLITPSLI